MTNESKLRKAIYEAEAVERLVNEEIIKAAFDAITNHLSASFLATKTEENRVREDIYFMHRGIIMLKDFLQLKIDDGKTSREALSHKGDTVI